MGSSVGVLLGHGLYVYWEYHKYPELYEMQSAPWCHHHAVDCGSFDKMVIEREEKQSMTATHKVKTADQNTIGFLVDDVLACCNSCRWSFRAIRIFGARICAQFLAIFWTMR